MGKKGRAGKKKVILQSLARFLEEGEHYISLFVTYFQILSPL
jgi:hypothetical protein